MIPQKKEKTFIKRVRKHVNPLAIIHEVSFAGFTNDNPIILEIGAETGYFAEQMVEKFPNKNFILCEIRIPVVKKLQEKFKNCENVRIFDGNAVQNLQNLLQSSIEKKILVEGIIINFPDPWPKKKHHKRRIITADFLENASLWLPKDTWVYFQTDFLPLFEDTMALLEERNDVLVEVLQDSFFACTTRWEERKIYEKTLINRLRFQF